MLLSKLLLQTTQTTPIGISNAFSFQRARSLYYLPSNSYLPLDNGCPWQHSLPCMLWGLKKQPLNQGLANSCLQIKSSPSPVFVNKALLSFAYGCHSTTKKEESNCERLYILHSLKYLLPGPSQKNVCCLLLQLPVLGGGVPWCIPKPGVNGHSGHV